MPYLIHNAIALELLENSSNTFIHFLLGPLKIPFKFFFSTPEILLEVL